jgi:hypothetical protein
MVYNTAQQTNRQRQAERTQQYNAQMRNHQMIYDFGPTDSAFQQ